jgi:hypothetical protein
MPYKNYEDKLKRSREYHYENRDTNLKRNKERYDNLTKEQKEEIRAKRKQWERENKAEINAKRKERKEKHRKHLIDMLGGKCCGCGTIKNLQFDHLDRTKKSFNIGNNLAAKLEKLEEEAKKCQLLCKECHQIKTLINHDCEQITYGKRVVEVKTEGNRIIVTLE